MTDIDELDISYEARHNASLLAAKVATVLGVLVDEKLAALMSGIDLAMFYPEYAQALRTVLIEGLDNRRARAELHSEADAIVELVPITQEAEAQ